MGWGPKKCRTVQASGPTVFSPFSIANDPA
jgi:hypothetical protein